jgi:hypothetical protein
MGEQAVQLLIDGLLQDLMRGRDPNIDRYAHGAPPGGGATEASVPDRPTPTAGGAGKPGPSAALHWLPGCGCAGRASGVSYSPPR